ncbi:MAG: pyridoxine 5'-phosphate synthase [Reinekea sp.]|jgi:pyridoxine 5-phosphate synthase
MSTLFSVNLNKLALLRNSRGNDYPNLGYFVERLIGLGVKGFTVHPRPDQRHIRYEDVYEIKDLLRKHSEIEFNIEGNPNERFIELVKDVKPHQCTLVPDDDNQLTSDHGYDVQNEGEYLSMLNKAFASSDIRCAVFLDANITQMGSIIENNIGAVELYTEEWATKFNQSNFVEAKERYLQCVQLANKHGVRVNAGHDLNLENLRALLDLGDISEVSIGHAFTMECIEYGIDQVVSRYLEICSD